MGKVEDGDRHPKADEFLAILGLSHGRGYI
jgi:hypothetical protein